MTTPTNIAYAGNRASRASSLKQQIRNAERKTIPFRLAHTGNGEIVVGVQRPSLPYMLQAGLVPATFRSMIDDQIRKFGKANAPKTVDISQLEIEKMIEQYGAGVLTWELDVINATVIAGFIEPMVTMDKALADDPDSPYIFIEEIAYEDRQAFYEWCNAEAEAEVEAVKRDAGEASPGVDLGVVPAGEGLRVSPDPDIPGMVVGSRIDEV